MAKRVERIKKLTGDLGIVKNLIKNNSEWKPKQRSIALFTFCYTKAEEDTIYMLCCFSGRYDSIVEELEQLIEKLEAKE